MKELQKNIKEFCTKHNLDSPVEHRILDTMSELGEVSKEILKMSNYGREKFILNDKLNSELGDLFYSLITVANTFDIDLEEEVFKSINKYKKRLKRGSPDSENDSTEQEL